MRVSRQKLDLGAVKYSNSLSYYTLLDLHYRIKAQRRVWGDQISS